MKEQMIVLRRGERKKVAERFNVTLPCVSESLRFKRHKEQHREMRSYAMNTLQGYYVEL